ncbi:RING/FYVE/PHD-type [Hexamita inflata]|uniref:RING/FYVE/PHD-type n=1 Tax=Hexamita inflata TaxID=28002 RepID=A0AA86TQ45_9EUKA|nr:RING/FYVE/PHD-type [Hexamita inflata]
MKCPHYINIYTLQQGDIFSRLLLQKKNCVECVSFDSLWICLTCKQNFCEVHLIEHFQQCARSICYFPQKNVSFCFSCNVQLLSLHMRTLAQQQSFIKLQQKFSPYREYSLSSTLQLPPVGKQDVETLTDPEVHSAIIFRPVYQQLIQGKDLPTHVGAQHLNFSLNFQKQQNALLTCSNLIDELLSENGFKVVHAQNRPTQQLQKDPEPLPTEYFPPPQLETLESFPEFEVFPENAEIGAEEGQSEKKKKRKKKTEE